MFIVTLHITLKILSVQWGEVKLITLSMTVYHHYKRLTKERKLSGKLMVPHKTSADETFDPYYDKNV